MPISIPYDWEEDEENISVKFHLTKVKTSSIDIFSSDAYLKVNCSPYFAQIDLRKEIVDEKSSAVIDGTGVAFKFVKAEPGLWGKLIAEGDKTQIEERRNASIARKLARLEEERQAAQKKKEQDARVAFDKQWELEKERRATIEERKLAEQREAEAQVFGRPPSQSNTTQPPASHESENESENEQEETTTTPQQTPEVGEKEELTPLQQLLAEARAKAGESAPKAPVRKTYSMADSYDRLPNQSSASPHVPFSGVRFDRSIEEESTTTTTSSIPPVRGSGSVPGPRQGATIQVTFTPRVLPTPAREGKDEEMMKQLGLSTGDPSEQKALPPASSNEDDDDQSNSLETISPAFLKDKGDSLYKQGDFRGAIHAYTDAIARGDKSVANFTNRSACYLRLNMLRECVADCDLALSRLLVNLKSLEESREDAKVESSKRTIAKTYARRGNAHYKLNDLRKAYEDYRKALVHTPGDSDLKSDFDAIAKLISGETQNENENEKSVEQVREENDSGKAAEATPPPLPSESEKSAAESSPVKASENLARAADLKEIGDNKYLTGDIDSAIRAYDEALSLDPSLLQCYSNRSLCHFQKKELSKCISDCEELVSRCIAPDFNFPQKAKLLLKAYARRGACYTQLGNIQKAYEDYEQAVRMFPSDEGLRRDFESLQAKVFGAVTAQWYANRGQFFLRSGDTASALDSFSKALEKDPENAEYLSLRSECLSKLSETQES